MNVKLGSQVNISFGIVGKCPISSVTGNKHSKIG